MKICYLANNAIPAKTASALQIVKMCEAFSQNGNNVLLICPNTKVLNEDIFKFYNVKKKFEIKKLKLFKSFPLGIYYYFFSIISIFCSLSFKPDIYITRNFYSSFLLTYMGKKNILELHHSLEIESRIVRFICKYFNFFNNKNLFRLVAITKNIKSHYSNEYNIDINKFIISPSGTSITPKFFSFNFSKARLKIGYFGSINKSRGIDLILKLSKIDRKNDYFIYGDLEKYKNLNLKNNNKNLFLYDYVPLKNIVNEISKMDILIMPYLDKITSAGDVGNITNFTSPLKLFDYLVNGKIIICSNIPVLKEILKDNQNAIFIKNFNRPFAWKSEIDKIKNLNQKRLIISKNNFKIGKKYSHKIRAINILKDFKKI